MAAGCAPVFVDLQRAGAGADHLLQRAGQRGRPLAEHADIDRQSVESLDGACDVPRPRCAGGGQRAMRRAGAAAHHAGDAGGERLVHLRRRDEMDMGVDAAGSQDLAFAGNDFGARPDDDVDTGLGVRVAGLADCGDAPVVQADIGLVDAGMVKDDHIGDDGVQRALGARKLALAHAVADNLAAPELHLLAIDGEVLLHLDEKIGVGKPDLVAGRGAEHLRVCRAADPGWH